MAGKGNLANLRPPWKPGQSGNPRGSSRQRRELGRLLAGHGGDPFAGDALAFLSLIYRDPRLPLALRLEAATRAARFQHPSLSASLTATMKRQPAEAAPLTADHRRRRIAELLEQTSFHRLAAP
jgi:hypothetical protein